MGGFKKAMNIVIAIILLLGSCSQTNDQLEPEVDFLISTEGGAYTGSRPSPERIEELRRAVQRWEREVDSLAQAFNQSASANKLLANELIQQGLYGPALEALQRAMALQSENASIYYLAAVAAARGAPAHQIDGRKDEFLQLAESMYRSALRLDQNHRDALFGLGVLLAFEMDRPVEALEPVERLVEIETGNMQPRFLKANILVRLGRDREAIEVYEDIAQRARSNTQRDRALANRDELRRRN
jgi:tetratricopeptide (TPR) repeat protein